MHQRRSTPLTPPVIVQSEISAAGEIFSRYLLISGGFPRSGVLADQEMELRWSSWNISWFPLNWMLMMYLMASELQCSILSNRIWYFLLLLAFGDTRFQKSLRARVRTTQTWTSVAVALSANAIGISTACVQRPYILMKRSLFKYPLFTTIFDHLF